MWTELQNWFFSLGEQYGVDPIVFGAIYVGAIPLFLASVAWIVRNRRTGRLIAFPVMCAGACFVSAYVYLAIVGRNIPVWVWVFLAALVVYGAWSSIRNVRSKIAAVDAGDTPAA